MLYHPAMKKPQYWTCLNIYIQQHRRYIPDITNTKKKVLLYNWDNDKILKGSYKMYYILIPRTK
jgi:hypothetical protein